MQRCKNTLKYGFDCGNEKHQNLTNIQCRVVVQPTEAKWKRYLTGRQMPTCRVCTALREKKESLLMWKTLCSEPSSPASLAAASLGCPPVCFCLHPATNDSRLTNAAAAPPPPPPPPPLIPVCCLPSTLLHITGFSKMASLDLFGASSKQHLSLGSTSSNENTFLPAAYGGDLTNKKVKNYTSDCLEHSWRFGITLIRV